jgi:uncharacterized Zn-binding protein involved in type VI secretion
MPPAARVADQHVCPAVDAAPHVGGPILPVGEPTVLIGFMPAARQGDMALCVGPPDTIIAGESTVLIGHQPAARLGDPMAHGGLIVLGDPSVLIGSSAQADALHTDLPFCEECKRGDPPEEPPSPPTEPPAAEQGDEVGGEDDGVEAT